MKRILALPLLALAAMVVTGSRVQAQSDTCVIVNGVWCIEHLDAAGNIISIDCPPGSTGNAEFTPVNGETIPPDGPVNVDLQPDNVDATSVDPNLGVIRTTYDASRPPSNTTINSVGADRFPARVRIHFNANVTVSSEPGKVYANANEIELSSDNANSLQPFVNERFTLSNDVDFYDVHDPARTITLRLQAGTTFVTVGAGNGPLN
ncbi:MAG: hypothetical protein JST22_09535 [Bacteroidetes bacterium]|nr:hypothetical protein [Bacteroidota bacterium]